MSANPVADQIAIYYSGLLPLQYKLPKATATIQALASGNDGAHGLLGNTLLLSIRTAFDLLGINGNPPAVGQQLDFLGELIGPSRNFAVIIDYAYTQNLTYEDSIPDIDASVGEVTYEDPWPPPYYQLTYEDFVEDTLVDGDYRRVLAFVAKTNALNFSYGAMDALLLQYFQLKVNLVVGPMAWTYQHLTSDTDDLFEILKQMNLLPAPAGVAVAVQEVPHF